MANETEKIITTIDIKHGKWLRDRCEETDKLIVYCSLCGNREAICDDGYVHRQYCSHCGAKMSEEEQHGYISD